MSRSVPQTPQYHREPPEELPVGVHPKGVPRRIGQVREVGGLGGAGE
ncbi:hypothetical protein [Streptomyces coffeae]|uniref:Uncharacterized protein n=1 Tax=Streptomyces coffeae TaxID=621382 RepID=A0ABS1NMY8_9ACTN|nr:hypothetical protein [Streptomyces coffeae]MBL1101465.1 hypothetical protein [Streptomyces coffeae]